MLTVDPTHPTPIWRQIQDGLRRLVASGALAPSEPVPSVRDLARRLRVNPLTVQKATRGLVDDGVLEIRRGQGTFVAAAPPAPTEALADELDRAAVRLAGLARTLGFDAEQTLEAVRRGFATLENDPSPFSPDEEDDR